MYITPVCFVLSLLLLSSCYFKCGCKNKIVKTIIINIRKNNLLQNLISIKSDVTPEVLRTCVLVISFAAGEYANIV